MLRAIEGARRSVHLEVYAFAPTGVGALFIDALSTAAGRGVSVHVLIDGWGSGYAGLAVAAALRQAGCSTRIHNRLLALWIGRLGRNHRKLLLVDDEIAFLGGINIGDENLDDGTHVGWADLALEVHGPQPACLGRMIRRERGRNVTSGMRIYLCGLGGGWRMRRIYLQAFARATDRIDLAHGYFLPDREVMRAIKAAARRGVQVRLLLTGDSDVPLARVATRRLYRELLASGVEIHEWSGSVLHSKIATIDGLHLLVGSFNLDPFSLANMESLADVSDRRVVLEGQKWIEDHFAESRVMTSLGSSSRLQRWWLDPIGYLIVRLIDAALALAVLSFGWGNQQHARPSPWIAASTAVKTSRK